MEKEACPSRRSRWLLDRHAVRESGRNICMLSDGMNACGLDYCTVFFPARPSLVYSGINTLCMCTRWGKCSRLSVGYKQSAICIDIRDVMFALAWQACRAEIAVATKQAYCVVYMHWGFNEGLRLASCVWRRT